MQDKRIVRAAVSAVFLLCCVLLTGCGSGGSIYSNFRALEELEPVGTLGIDRSMGGLTVSAAAEQGGDSSPALLKQTGADLQLGLEALQNYAGERRLFFAHTRYFVIGEDYAADGIGEILDYVERDVNPRMGTELFVLRDGRAAELLTDCTNATALLASIARDTALDGSSHVSSIRDTAVALSEYGAAVVCALRAETTAGSVFSEEPETTVLADGYAILKNGALCDFCEGTEAQALGFLAGYPGTVTRAVSAEGMDITAELLRSGTPDIRFSETPGGYRAEITLRLNAAVSTVRPSPEETALPDEALLCDRISALVSGDVTAVLQRAAALNADFLGLSGILRTASGAEPPPDFLQNTEFTVRVETAVTHSYDMTAPLGMTGGGT